MKNKMTKFATLVLCVALLQCFAVPAIAQGWVQNNENFSKQAKITKIRLKDNGGKSALFYAVTLVYDENGTYNQGSVTINAKKLTVKTSNGKTEFQDMEEDEDGWRVFTLDKPAYFKYTDLAPCCFTNVQFFVDNVSAAQEERMAQEERRNAQSAQTTDNLKPQVTASKPPIGQFGEEDVLTTPEKEGYTLLDTKNIGGLKWDYYAEGVRTVRFNNGDFATFWDGTKENMAHRLPYGRERPSIGDYKLTNDRGLVFKQEGGVRKVELFNGGVLINRAPKGCWFNDEGEFITPYLQYVIGDQLYLPNQQEPLEYMKYSLSRVDDIEGYLSGDRLYTIEFDDRTDRYGDTYQCVQIFDGVPYYALESDTIVEATYSKAQGDSYGSSDVAWLDLKYANGDSLRFKYGQRENFRRYDVESGSIHRNGGVLTIKQVNGKSIKTLTWPNGDKFIGDFKYGGMYPVLAMKYLAEPELTIWEGTLIKSDGTRVQYANGKSELEIAAENQRRAAAEKAAYDKLCQKYGKKYVDSAAEGKPIVGMPEELLKAAFNLKLIEKGNNYTLYRIEGVSVDFTSSSRSLFNNVLLYSIWVTNGRVSSIRYWNN